MTFDTSWRTEEVRASSTAGRLTAVVFLTAVLIAAGGCGDSADPPGMMSDGPAADPNEEAAGVHPLAD